ncbi:MAG: RpiB/LacA/LacB family sugar-phosphate isomerase [Patescibacteria group bacterium]|nr:RpiB/LacA/LacB family sugar-phosphate isomerase [Patescibacteria group bacterium]MDD5715404.1 RpiB/LacA/LacB family sugar-phosphate isomerase [Patescibacteria group bacterium]
MKVFIGADHAGFQLKGQLVEYFQRIGIPVEDLGNDVFDPVDDYPDFAKRVALKVARTGGRGILVCHNGAGMCMAANKVHGVRAIVAMTPAYARSSRIHDDTNVLCLGQGFVSYPMAAKIARAWLKEPFDRQSRRVRRLKKVKAIERGSV